MKHSNISIFVPHIGCPNMCSFCNQHTISGAQKAPTAEEVRDICKKAFDEISSPSDTEIAFFGGSFTAIPRGYMLELLESVQDFIGEGKFRGIRISTRPDCIDRPVLELLKKYGVTSIELGAQSMSNDVLAANDRGHTAQDIVNASGLIREYGFELGLQMMLGLYGSTPDDDFDSTLGILNIHPDTVRIYPVVILKGTRLAELYEAGIYDPYPFEEVVEMSATALLLFENSGIRVLKCGLHASEFVEQDMIGGFYHPAFREICESEIYKEEMRKKIGESENILYCRNLERKRSFEFAVAPSCISKALGHKKSNYEYFKQYDIDIKIVGDESIPKYKCELRR